MTFFDYPSTEPAPEAAPEALLADAAPEDWSDLLGAATMRQLVVGETLFPPGSEGCLYLVLEGSVEVLAPASRSTWRRVGLAGKGNVIGELSFLDGQLETTLSRAVQPATVAQLSHAGFTRLAASRPDLALLLAMDLGRILAGRLR